MKKAIKIILIVLLALILLIAALIFCAFYGNPVSYLLAKHSAESYVEEHYADEGYHVVSVLYNPKFNHYNASVMAHDSRDKHFIIDVDMLGNVLYDDYGNIDSGFNTWSRLNMEYGQAPYAAFDNMGLDLFISYAELEYNGDTSEFVPDGEYDVMELGRKWGRIVVYIREDAVTFDRAAELLLKVKESFDREGIPFDKMDFVLQQDPLTVQDYDEIHIRDFKYVDITQENLAEKIKLAHDELSAYYAEQDKEKGVE